MRITIMALGSQGDVQPYTALGVGLKRTGYAVRVATFQNFRGMVEGAGLDFHPVKGDAQAILSGVSIGDSGNNPLTMLKGIRKSFAAIADDYIDAFADETLFDSDLIINQLPGALFGYDLAEKLGIPHMGAAVMPLALTSAFPLCLVPAFSLGGWYNRLTYLAPEQAVWAMFRAPTQRYRAKLGLPPAPFTGHFARMRATRMPILNGFSPHVVSRPPDWGEHIHVTGYWLLDEPDWSPPQDLIDFLDAGIPPVFFGFGSMPVRDPARLTAIILDALKQSGQRGILSAGWAGLSGNDLPDTVKHIGYTPYNWLFPRMAGVVHHGGSGTTGLALRSGVPSMITPFVADQFYWARHITELGVSPGGIPHKQLSADKLADAIRVMVTDGNMRARAAALGEKLRAEDGIGEAVRVIRYLTH